MNRQEYYAYLRTDEWQEKRKEALEWADHRCQLCYSKDRLDVHHRSYYRVGKEKLSDLTVLCRECHARHHGRTSKPGDNYFREQVENTLLLCVAERPELRDIYGEVVKTDHFTTGRFGAAWGLMRGDDGAPGPVLADAHDVLDYMAEIGEEPPEDTDDRLVAACVDIMVLSPLIDAAQEARLTVDGKHPMDEAENYGEILRSQRAIADAALKLQAVHEKAARK